MPVQSISRWIRLSSAICRGDEIFGRLSAKLGGAQPLDDTDCMQLMIVPLTYQVKKDKQKAVRKAYDLSEQISDEETVDFILPGIIVFCEKIIDKETYAKIKERIRMTKIGREFEEGKRAAEARGEANGVAKSVRALMASMKVSAKEAMDMLAVPDGMRNAVRMML